MNTIECAEAIRVRLTGRYAQYTSLDVPEPQVLVAVDGAAPDLYWHYVLLVKIEAGVWIAMDPTGEVTYEDLRQEEVIPLQRAAVFPTESRPYLAHGKHNASQLSAFRLRGRQLAEIHGVTTAGASSSEGASWLFADSSHPSFGSPVPLAVLGDPAKVRVEAAVGLVFTSDSSGSAESWTFMESVEH